MSTTDLWSTHEVEQLSFSLFLSILVFDFDLNLGLFMTFWGPNWLFWVGVGSTTVLGSSHVSEQLSFSLFLSMLIFDFNLILGSFLTFCGPNELFLGV